AEATRSECVQCRFESDRAYQRRNSKWRAAGPQTRRTWFESADARQLLGTGDFTNSSTPPFSGLRRIGAPPRIAAIFREYTLATSSETYKYLPSGAHCGM